MQVSFVCSEHSIKSRSAEDRLNRQNAGSPSLGTRGKGAAPVLSTRTMHGGILRAQRSCPTVMSSSRGGAYQKHPLPGNG
uniref:Uncharacterized protein n=1 Tax=Cyanoderma ruficeps TaxID=181631 RepID=A0A8C3QPU9_9PASS